MSKVKYQEGDFIGVNKDILLLKRIKPLSNGRGFLCKFLCPYCKTPFIADLYSVNRQYYSCGCYRKEHVQFQKNDLIGQKFGQLTVLEDSQERVIKNKVTGETSDVIWICQCECGNITKVSTSHLTTGHTTSCGQCCISKGEDKIKNILDELHIKYQQQKRFPECKDNASLPFDFYLPDYNCCIEYDGEQHFHIPKNKTSTWFAKETIDKTQKHDKIKNQYCLDNHIFLIRIPYTDFDNLSIDYISDKINNLKRGTI